MTDLEAFYQEFLENPIICTDSRAVQPGSFFLALKGESFNGNRYAVQALEAGCKKAIVDEADSALDDRFLLVEDGLKFLQDLARFHRQQLRIPVIGLTGTNGKTTTKELISQTLGAKYRVQFTRGNFNNHIGVPLTILSARTEHEILVVEMGANHPGEIEFLCSIAQPSHGLITNVGAGHLEGFGSLEGVIQTKTALYRHLAEKKGKIFYNAEDALLSELVTGLGAIPYSEFGAVVEAGGGETGEDLFLKFLYQSSQVGEHEPKLIETKLIGAYNIPNVLAALSLAAFFEVPLETAATALSAYQPGLNRSQLLETSKNVVVMDAYNANPVSMSLALRNFSDYERPDQVVILGQMLELGAFSAQAHTEIVELVEELGFDAFFVGAAFAECLSDADFPWFPDVHTLKEFLVSEPLSGKLILLKGSRGNRLEALVEVL